MNSDIIHKTHFRINENNHRLWFDLAAKTINPLLSKISISVEHISNSCIISYDKEYTVITFNYMGLTSEELDKDMLILSLAFSIFGDCLQTKENGVIRYRIRSLLICEMPEEIEQKSKMINTINKYNL